jgi:hypothetical protein
LAGDQRFGDVQIALVAAVAKLIVDGDVVVEIVLDLGGDDIDVGAKEVAAGVAVEVIVRDRGRGAVEPGYAVIGGVVGLDVVVIQGRSCIGAEAEGDLRREAEAAVFGAVTAGDTIQVAHDVQPDRGTRYAIDRPVDVGGDTLGAVGAEADAALGDRRELRLLGDLVDGAAAGAAAEQDRGGALDHLDGL